MSEFAACRKNARPKGYAPWRPQTKSRVLLERVHAVLAEYEQQLPLTVRQIFYRLVGAYRYEKTDAAYERLANLLVRARRARLIASRTSAMTASSASRRGGTPGRRVSGTTRSVGRGAIGATARPAR